MIIFARDFNLSAHLFLDQMTKVLFIVRHAQSAGKQSGQRDYDRELTPLGKNNSLELGKKIKKSAFRPDFVLASAAVRTTETVENINKALTLPDEKIEFRTALYEGLMAEWLDAIREIPDRCSAAILVGHNPGISMLATSLFGQNIDLAPCELTGIEMGLTSWKEVQEGKQKTLKSFTI